MPAPHIVLITADQLRQDALGCYGGRAVATPHLDRLAAAGTRYDHAYTNSPLCLPSRCALVTGRYPHNNGSYSNFRECRLDPAQPNLYTLLRDAGYTTSHIGKCHFAPVPYGEPKPDRSLPYDEFRASYQRLGIDHLILQDGKQVSVWFADDYNQELDRAGYLAAYRDAIWNRDLHKVFPFPGPAEWHPDRWVGRKAAEFVDGYDAERPLFLWLSFSGPHFPFDAPDDYLDRVNADQVGQGVSRASEFADPGRIHYHSFHGPRGIEGAGAANGGGTQSYSAEYWTALRTRYFANVALIDEQVGAVLAALERRFGDNVLVIFTADHGEMLGDHRLWGKNNCGYDDVLTVPLLVRDPGGPAPRTTAARVMLIDLLPTCLAAAGVTGYQADGASLPDVVARGGHPYIFSESENFVAVTDGTTKYIHVRRDGEPLTEVFDLAADPHEFENVAAEPAYADRKAALQQAVVDLFMDRLLP
ncbi:MAG: sulfatase family protein [Thermomicrobiales bacterium]